MKERLDKLLVAIGLAENRQKARSIILSGAVLVDGVKQEKAGAFVSINSPITLKESVLPYHGLPYVSRGGLKLEKALEAFNLDVKEKVVMDVGASTGGFTDCLLKKGAKRVYAVDVGYGQLAWRLRQDPRVVNLERTHILKLSSSHLPEAVDLVTIDVSFISLTRVLPKTLEFLKPVGEILALIKPQFEVGRNGVGKGGIVRDLTKRQEAVEQIRDFADGLNLKCAGSFESPVRGQDGNVEYFLLLQL
jgi:23S rRNA (cytidine1920-2'-O)/16S rRNA (cytidine1409-2'-O)-methyltransferase